MSSNVTGDEVQAVVEADAKSEKPAKDKPVKDNPVQDKPVKDKTVDAKGSEKKPEKKKPATAKPAKKKPAGAKAASKKKASSDNQGLSSAKNLHKSSVSDEVVIRFSHVTKTFNLYKNDRGRFLGLFHINKKGQFLGSVNANDDLSFEVKKGEAVAFLGLNGAGKSTALKMITGVMHPTSGTVEVHGRVSALLELTAGFDSKLTGRENIHLRGQIMGLSRAEIDELIPGVEEFADLGLYFDQPMKSYSSGMKARLGFAFAVAINPEILVVDEALSVGDKAFRRKCLHRIREIMMDENVTVLFVTHSSSTAQEFCSRGIVLEKGTKVFEGTIEEATVYYEEKY